MQPLIVITVMLLVQNAEGLTCLTCDGVPVPRICNKVVECYDGESCSVEKALNEFGEHVYNLGCLSNKVCNNFTSILQSPTVTCSECCRSADLCNSKGCGEQGYPAERGPICYNCPLHTNTGRCHDIEFCSHGEACKSTEESHVAIIGKRDVVMEKRSHEQHICDSCCEADVCNKNCTTARLRNDPCQSSPCNHGNCTWDGGNFKCECYPGYTGSLCENDINECLSSPCMYGVCSDSIDDYLCSCYPGYSGRNCQQNINECSSGPCYNGTCIDGVGNYSCVCNHGFAGNQCERNIDECSSGPCHNGTCIDGVGNYSCVCNHGFAGNHCERMSTDCLDILRYGGKREDGIYTVRTWKSHRLIKVYCDMTTDGGGWTVFQYRFSGSVDFYRRFSEYEQGFGNLKSEFWLGLRYIQELAAQGRTDLRIDLKAANGTTGFETFDNFSLSAGPAYTLHIGSTIASSRISTKNNRVFPYHNGLDFTTYDHDADSDDTGNCAVQFHGAWWYNRCYWVNLNGAYLTPGTSSDKSMNYYSFSGTSSLKSSKMMMRRK